MIFLNILGFVVAALVAGKPRSGVLASSDITNAKEFHWTDIVPTQSLVFHDCFEKYQCARLDVPMDWNRTDGKGSRVALAIIKIPARVPVTDPRYGGSILLNPGGPGGSGVRFLMGESAEKIHKVVDATVAPPQGFNEEDKYFDVMSWDPRGVNNTTPQVICFPDISARENWVRSMSAEGTMMSSDVAFFTKWARYMAISGACTERMASVEDGEDNLLEHVNTAPVVGDMVAIIEALGEWREKEALRVLDGHANMEKLEQNEFFASAESQAVLKERRQTSSERETVIERTKWKKGEEKLLYWGFSYGTALGATFSAIQPHRVGRVILDGVVDGRDYYSLKFEKNLIDNDAVFSTFFDYCALAGPVNCAFSTNKSETAQDLRSKFDTILRNLQKQPLSVLPSTSPPSLSTPDIITSSDLLIHIRESLYSPIKSWPNLATILSDLSHGNGTSLSLAKAQEFPFQDAPPSQCTACDDPYSPTCQGPKLGNDPEMSAAVWCADGYPGRITEQEEFRNETLRMLMKQSPLFGDGWAELKMGCVGWDVVPKWRYSGVFEDVRTVSPVLWVGTSGDAVCPMMNARAMAKRFPGSVALEQASQGHCSISSPSLCTAKYVRSYFQTGKLPANGTVCEVDQVPFGNDTKTADELEVLNVEERELWDVIKDFRGF